MKTMYHATKTSNLLSILDQGLKRNSIEKAVYLCDKPEDAAKFLRVTLCTDFVVIPVKVHERFLVESFDHSEAFFRCKAWMYMKDIPARNIEVDDILQYKI